MFRYETVTTRRELAEELADGMSSFSDEMRLFVDLTAQDVYVYIPVDITGVGNGDRKGHEVVEFEPLRSGESFGIMESFCRGRDVSLARALRGPHPFRAFKRAVQYAGVLEEWYAFKNGAEIDIAESRLVDAGVDVVNGKIVCTDRTSVSVYEPEDEMEERE